MEEAKPAAAPPAAPPAEPPAVRPSAAAAALSPQPSGDALVEQWWNDHFPGSAVAQVTAAWNVAFAAKEDLKQRLKKGK
ncbi:MAG TPA: hypothetical protein VFA12_05375 [Stellaceae bacterium]|nr:hypothetical protein [Stellaceae bacterium]